MKLTLPILEKSQTWVIINKPVGVSVHNDTNDVRSLLSQQLPKNSFEDIYPVHRLEIKMEGLTKSFEAPPPAEFSHLFSAAD